jgi:hypothetical protein
MGCPINGFKERFDVVVVLKERGCDVRRSLKTLPSYVRKGSLGRYTKS